MYNARVFGSSFVWESAQGDTQTPMTAFVLESQQKDEQELGDVDDFCMEVPTVRQAKGSGALFCPVRK